MHAVQLRNILLTQFLHLKFLPCAVTRKYLCDNALVNDKFRSLRKLQSVSVNNSFHLLILLALLHTMSTQRMLCSTQARSTGGIRGQCHPHFCAAANFVVARKICFKHTTLGPRLSGLLYFVK